MLSLIICFVCFLQFATAKPISTIPELIKSAEDAEFSDSKWSQFSKINKEYKLQYYVKANWYNAYLFCRDNGMQLATINSQEEQDYVTELIKDYGIKSPWWISGADLGDEGRFSWYSSGNLLRYTNWAPNQPDNLNQNENCVQLRNDNLWNDYQCSVSYSFICERNL